MGEANTADLRRAVLLARGEARTLPRTCIAALDFEPRTGFGDESDGEEEGGINRPSKYRTGKTQGKNQGTGGDFWDF